MLMVCAVTGRTAAAKPLPTLVCTKRRRLNSRRGPGCRSRGRSGCRSRSWRVALLVLEGEWPSILPGECPHEPEPAKALPWAAIDMGSNSFRLEIGHVLREGATSASST